MAHELTHVVQQRREILSPLGYEARSDQVEIAYEIVPNKSLIQKEEGAEIRQEQQEINVALYDQNPAHMHRDHRLHTELRTFHGWAADWAQDYSASSHAVRVHSDIHDALTGVIAQLPPQWKNRNHSLLRSWLIAERMGWDGRYRGYSSCPWYQKSAISEFAGHTLYVFSRGITTKHTNNRE